MTLAVVVDEALALVELAGDEAEVRRDTSAVCIDLNLLAASDALVGLGGTVRLPTTCGAVDATQALERAARLLDGLQPSDRHLFPVVVARSHIARAIRNLRDVHLAQHEHPR